MKLFTTAQHLGVVLVCLIVTLLILTACAKGYLDSVDRTPKAADLWNVDSDLVKSHLLYDYLLTNGWVKEGVTVDEFDYIYTLATQFAEMYDLPDSEVLAQIAQESRFDGYANNGTAHGLLQLVPIYQEQRMRQFVEDNHIFTHDDFYDPRLNLITGLDYMAYIVHEETNENYTYALMWYNEGAIAADRHYNKEGTISYYARTILNLADEIDEYLRQVMY